MKELLFPFSFLYRAGLEIDKKITREQELPKPVISIGNITWGGTGKTPMVIKTARVFAITRACSLRSNKGLRQKTAQVPR